MTGLAIIAHPAAEAGPVVELAGVQGVQILTYDGKVPAEMGIRACWILMDILSPQRWGWVVNYAISGQE